MFQNSFKYELKQTFQLALPIIISQLGVILMGTFDNITVGRLLGATSLGAAGIANSIAFLIASLAVGGFAVMAPMVSKYVAENNNQKITLLFYNGLIVALIYSLVLSFISFIIYQNFHLLNQKQDIEELAIPFFLLIGLSNIPMYFFLVIKQFSDGFSKPKVVMYITLIGLVFNVTGNITLIEGLGPFPKLGLQGAAWATIASRVLMLTLLFYYLKSKLQFSFLFNVTNWKFDLALVKLILSRSIPSGFQSFFEIAAFSCAVVMMGWISENALAAHQIAINVAATTYMMATGFAHAGGIRIGEAWGRKSASELLLSGRAAYAWVIAFMGMCMIIIMLFGSYIVEIYISDTQVLEAALPLLTIAAIFQLSDGVQAVGLGVLRGLADIKLPTIITFIAYWVIALPAGYFLGFYFNLQAQGIWIGLLSGLTVSAVLLYIRYRKVSQKLAHQLL